METVHDWTAILRPILELVLTIVVPIIALKVSTWLGAKTEKDVAELEKLLRDAIHASASNAILYALQKKGINISAVNPENVGSIIETARAYVKDKNPDALRQLGVDDGKLKDIITAKLPATR